MDRRDANYYEAHAQTINLDKITSNEQNATILQKIRDKDATFDFLQIMGDSNYIDEHDFVIDEGDDLGWLGYFVGNSSTLQSLCIESLPERISVHRFGAFIEGLNRNQSIETLNIWADIGSTHFRQMGDFFRNNNNLRELSFGSMDAIGIESAHSIAFMLSQCEQSNLRVLSFQESNASDAVLAEIVTAISSHSNLEVLDLDGNNLYRDGSVALGKALKACNNPRLQKLVLWWNFIDDEGLRALADGMRNCHNLSKLYLAGNDLITADGFRSLSTLFQSGHCNLKDLDLDYMNMGDDGASAIATGLASLNLLEELHLSDNAIGDDGARALGAGLANLQSLKTLYLSSNIIGDDGASALAAGLINLHSLGKLRLRNNSIGDLGLQALVEGLVNCDNNLKSLILSKNGTITASGLRSLSTILRSESCSLTEISVWNIPFGDDGAVALADALKCNTSMKQLYFDPDSARVTSGGWSAFSKLLCDKSSVNATYLSNHYLKEIGRWNDDEDAPEEVNQLLALNKHEDMHVAIHKILKSHPDFDIEPFFEWKLKLLPLVVSWFERVRTLVDDRSWISNESTEEIQSRQLSTMYNFVRGMPLVAIDGYHGRNNTATLAQTQTRKRKVDQLN